MQGLTSRLKNKVDFYGKSKIENELGEVDFDYKKIKTIWGEITPQGGTIKESQAGNIYADISHKITIRANELKNISNDMYFIHKDLKYNVKYSYPNFKYRDSVDIFCSLVVE